MQLNANLATANVQEASDGPTTAQLLARYRQPRLGASLFQLAVTLGLWATMWPIMWWSLDVAYWLTLLLAVPAAFLSVRLFVLQHDCGHGSFFRSRVLNERIGAALGVLTMTPYECWRRQHAIHHAGNGNLDHRGIGDIGTMTVEEYHAASRWERWQYRLYRHPVVLFVIGPFFHFAIRQRFTLGLPSSWRRERRSVHLTNLGLIAVSAPLIWALDWRFVVLLYLPVMAMATSIGVWLFYVQHQFNPTYWRYEREWDYETAAVEGSSYYHLPPVLRWLTANIGFHHIHHLDSRIPNYRLPEVYRNHPEMQKEDAISLLSSLGCARLALWDERRRRLVSFRAARRSAAPG